LSVLKCLASLDLTVVLVHQRERVCVWERESDSTGYKTHLCSSVVNSCQMASASPSRSVGNFSAILSLSHPFAKQHISHCWNHSDALPVAKVCGKLMCITIEILYYHCDTSYQVHYKIYYWYQQSCATP